LKSKVSVSRSFFVTPSRWQTWAVLALGAALLGGAREIQAQPLNEPPPRPLALSGPTTLDASGKNVIATTHVRPPPLPMTLKVTPPDDGLTAPAKPLHVVDYHPDADPVAAPPLLPAQVSVEVAGPDSVALGEPLHYELIVRNTGGSPACRVQVEEPLPADAKLLQSDPITTPRAGSLTWDLGTMEAGAERRLKIDLQHSGTAGMPQPPRVAYTAAAGLRTQVVRPALVVSLSGPETAATGAPVAFQIQLSNNGTAPIQHIILRDQLPPGLSYPRGYMIEADVGDLAPGQSRTVRLDAVAAQVGRYVNDIVAIADGGLRATSRCALEIVAGPEEKPSGGSSFAAARDGGPK
jgi:uncharacterized repeat protein (TIGR01451 family)